MVDEGAATKLLHEGASLLPPGIVAVKQAFERGAIVAIVNKAEETIAIGISNYGSAEIQKIRGKQSKTIEQILGYSYGSEVVHRSNMTRLSDEHA
jgi:glutamate 5-kinase